MDKFELEREYRLVEDKYENAKSNAAMYRAEYKRRCGVCVGYLGIAVIMVMFYNGTITVMFNYGPPLIYGYAGIMRLICISIGAIYGIFLFKKIYDVYLEGYSPRARKLAEKSGRLPLTLRAEKFDYEASKYENRLKEIQELMLENKMNREREVK